MSGAEVRSVKQTGLWLLETSRVLVMLSSVTARLESPVAAVTSGWLGSPVAGGRGGSG